MNVFSHAVLKRVYDCQATSKQGNVIVKQRRFQLKLIDEIKNKTTAKRLVSTVTTRPKNIAAEIAPSKNR